MKIDPLFSWLEEIQQNQVMKNFQGREFHDFYLKLSSQIFFHMSPVPSCATSRLDCQIHDKKKFYPTAGPSFQFTHISEL